MSRISLTRKIFSLHVVDYGVQLTMAFKWAVVHNTCLGSVGVLIILNLLNAFRLMERHVETTNGVTEASVLAFRLISVPKWTGSGGSGNPSADVLEPVVGAFKKLPVIVIVLPQ